MNNADNNTVYKLVQNLSFVYTNRKLVLKQDISQKITQSLGGVYNDIQTLRTARWMLPMIMQQISADGKRDENNYVYIGLSNLWDDMSNIYWYYRPSDAVSVTKSTITSQQFASGQASVADTEGTSCTETNIGNISKRYDRILQYYSDYMEPSWCDDTNTDVNYANYSYTLHNDNNENVHLYMYILHDPSLGMMSTAIKRKNVFGEQFDGYMNKKSWQQLISAANNQLTENAWVTDKEGYYAYEEISDMYDRTDASTMNDGYGYYRTTESPAYYFFCVAKDSFTSDKALGAIIGRLQGDIKANSVGEQVRNNFMHASITYEKEEENEVGTGIKNDNVQYTGLVRDVVDLQEFFTNVLPYMYEMTIISGGFDGKSGVLGDRTITEESQIYKGNLMSWAYRCNWAIKLMENSNFSGKEKIGLPNGEKAYVQNALLPECYEAAGRRMVFSEAQMYADGLSEQDLTLVELKAIKVNKEIAKKWTLLINYASTPGLTKEILYRMMGTIATEEFCREFSSNGILDNRYALYPQTIDLRYLSYDAVMKLLLMNVGHDTAYAYGDTMNTLLNNTDIITALLLLLCTVICVWVVPFMQRLVMALIFYLGFIAILRVMFSDARYKGKISGAQIVSNLMFMLYTIIYYAIIGGMMSISSQDEVLSVRKISGSTGNPMWMIILMILISVGYTLIMATHTLFCFRNYRDMGAETFGIMAHMITDKIKGVKETIKSRGNKSSKESKDAKVSTSDGGSEGSTSEEINITNNTNKEDNKSSKANTKSAWTEDGENNENKGAGDIIDKEIQKGKEIDKAEKEDKETDTKKDDKKEVANDTKVAY
jgi:hypothetical protein